MKNKIAGFLFFLISAFLFARPFTIIDSVHLYNLDGDCSCTKRYCNKTKEEAESPYERSLFIHSHPRVIKSFQKYSFFLIFQKIIAVCLAF